MKNTSSYPLNLVLKWKYRIDTNIKPSIKGRAILVDGFCIDFYMFSAYNIINNVVYKAINKELDI